MFADAVYDFDIWGEQEDVRLQYASAALVEQLCASSDVEYVWPDDDLDAEVYLAAYGPGAIGVGTWPGRLSATPTAIERPWSSPRHLVDSESASLALQLLGWAVVLMTVSSQSYNGWPNYATWYVFVWANACAYDYWQGRVTAICESEEAKSPLDRNEQIRTRLVRELRDWVQDKNPLREHASLYGDLLRGVIGEVDWLRIADNWLTEMDESSRRRPMTEPALRA
jgi:hypothetical protein